MPSRKADQIARVLRSEILSGLRAPGARLPTYDAFTEQFGVTRPTIARGVKALRREGLVTVEGTRGVFVAKTLPHHTRTLWVTSERPGTSDWSSVSATILDLIVRGETGLPGEVIPLVGVDGRANNPAYQTLCDAVARGSVAGLVLASSAMARLLPVLQEPGLARVAIAAPMPHASLLDLDMASFFERAAARVAARARGRRVAVLSPDAAHLARGASALRAHGVDGKRLGLLHIAPVGCEALTELLFDRADRPGALLVTDDSLVAPLLAGLARAKVRIDSGARRDLYVLAHCHWPRPVGAEAGVEHLGFDARELLAAAKACLDAQRAGAPCGGRVLPPRFADELPYATPTLASAA
jgi:Bacterial regulatory proteins, gntR family